MRKSLSLILVIILVLLAGCNNNPKTVEDSLKKAGIKFNSVVHVEETGDKGITLVFFKQNEEIRYGILKDKKWVMGDQLNNNENNLTWTYSNYELEIPMFTGLVNNKSIEKIIVKGKDLNKEGVIVHTESGEAFWFLLLDKPQNPPIQITGYNKNGDIVYTSDN